MTQHGINRINCGIPALPRLALVLAVFLSWAASIQALDLPAEFPLYETPPQDYPNQGDIQEQRRSNTSRSAAPSGSNRVFSSVSSPTYSIHRAVKPNGVGLVICPGGGFRDVWIDREGHDLALLLKDHGITCLVLKYRTQLAGDKNPENTWANYLKAVEADGRQAIRMLRRKAPDLGLHPDKIGICGFSAGGYLAILCSLNAEPLKSDVSSMPDFAGLFYPGIPEHAGPMIDARTASGKLDICPLFIMNARVDKLTPADKCVDFYAMLLRAQVKAELHVYAKGSHGFDLGIDAGKSAAIWPHSFLAWLSDCSILQQ